MDDKARERIEMLRTSSDATTRVLTTVLTRSPINRPGIAQLADVSLAAVTKAITPLVRVGLVDGSLDSGRNGLPGRPSNPVAMIPDALLVAGIKINRDEIIGVATDLTTTVLASTRAVPASPSPADVIDAIDKLYRELAEMLGDRAGRLARVGVTLSGDVHSATGVLRESAQLGWRDVALGEELSARLGIEVVIENDVRALAVGEHMFGVGLGTNSFAIVTIGRGIGAGLHLNGDVVNGAHGVMGELGHLPLAPPDRRCSCGRRGCVEAVAATSAIVAAVATEHGRELDLEAVVALARRGDAAATRAFDEAGRVIGLAVASLVNLVGPELVIIGGEAVSDFDLYRRSLDAAYHEHVFGSAERVRLVVRPHSFADWARGAAATATRSLLGPRRAQPTV
ncbi:ROK family protein [Actinoplanes sp. NPDC049596]|uniref:ROK family protein n=1 Tax=unclassified Actinoplanes TaxID=2626549 RepID=UPI00342EC342